MFPEETRNGKAQRSPGFEEPAGKALVPVTAGVAAVVAVLLMLVLAVYWQVGGHAFINLDDDGYVTANSRVLNGLTREGISWAFTTVHMSNWHPLTWLSHMLDVELFGPDPGWHHRVNVLFHLLNTELLFIVLWRMTGGLWQSAVAAALFGVHPLHVESVAWVAERKDVLSTLFWILTMGAYHRYVRRPGAGRYLLVLIPFALGLLAKPTLVTLPFVLLLLDWWPLGRAVARDSGEAPSWKPYVAALPRLILEKVPLLGLSAISCAITIRAQADALPGLDLVPFGVRLSNALLSYASYLGKTVWPSSLAVPYLHPGLNHVAIPGWEVAGAVLLLSALSFLSVRQAKQHPCLAVGWLWYLGTLVPVIGLVQVGQQALADRYTYVPLIGIFVAVAWGIPALRRGLRYRQAALGALAVATVALSVAAWVQAGHWRDGVTLFSRTAQATERNWLALNSLGAACSDQGRPREAIDYCREALRIKPDYEKAWNNLGVAYARLGEPRQAIDSFREALRIKPDFAETWYNLGLANDDLGQPQQAIGCYREALRLAPDCARTWNNLGVAYSRLGQPRQAVESFREALRIMPDFPEAQSNLSALSDTSGRPRQP